MVTRAEVIATFDEYNVRFFAGCLTTPKFRLQRMVHYCALWHWPCVEHPAGLLVLSKSSATRHRMGWRGTLLHEMIHIWLSERDCNDPHGPAFAAECNRIGRVLGLPDTSVSDAWCWPTHHMNLEPADKEQLNILDD